MLKENVTSGLWKFSDKISTKDLIEVATKWASEDHNYLQLYIRKVSKDQNGIGFMYQFPEDGNNKQNHDDYFNRTSDTLKRTFGNDLVGWDLSSSIFIIK